jgi:hypothetical protein
MFNRRPRPIRSLTTAYYVAKALKADAEYEMMIAESQAKLAETKLVPGFTKIYC